MAARSDASCYSSHPRPQSPLPCSHPSLASSHFAVPRSSTHRLYLPRNFMCCLISRYPLPLCTKTVKTPGMRAGGGKKGKHVWYEGARR
eukprot:766816-Hanusia_phi.AAC.6